MSEKDRLTRELTQVQDENKELKVHTIISNTVLHVTAFICIVSVMHIV